MVFASCCAVNKTVTCKHITHNSMEISDNFNILTDSFNDNVLPRRREFVH